LLKLPRRGEDDTEGDEDGAGEGAEGEDGEDGEVAEKATPIGGGKPFRTIQGKVYVIDGDQFTTDDDPKGEEKIDKFGNLLGGTSILYLCGVRKY